MVNGAWYTNERREGDQPTLLRTSGWSGARCPARRRRFAGCSDIDTSFFLRRLRSPTRIGIFSNLVACRSRARNPSDQDKCAKRTVLVVVVVMRTAALSPNVLQLGFKPMWLAHQIFQVQNAALAAARSVAASVSWEQLARSRTAQTSKSLIPFLLSEVLHSGWDISVSLCQGFLTFCNDDTRRKCWRR